MHVSPPSRNHVYIHVSSFTLFRTFSSTEIDLYYAAALEVDICLVILTH
jgi:hypothetical protein